MRKSRQIALSIVIGVIAGIGIEKATEKKQHLAKVKGKHIPFGPYEAFFKRPLDILLAGSALILLSPIMGITALLVKVNLGSPVLFTQQRPGHNEKIFKIYKYRTMTDKKDENGELLPDKERLTEFGQLLRSTSVDELPEVFNVLKGDMSIVGPRPQLVRDMVFMNDKQRMRHTVKPGISGLAQVMGRNAITWEEKMNWDLTYIEKISFWGDFKIIGLTIKKVFGKGESISELAIADDYGDALLKSGKISQAQYDRLQEQAKKLIHN